MSGLKAKVGTRGQIVIPKPIRDLFHIHPGEGVMFRVSNDEILIRKENGEDVLKRMLNRIKEKEPEPEKIDWNKEYYSQFVE